ncbi:MAG: ATP-binding protein [Rubrivivax sp.]|nr:ATP-binding protein [Rubrivivax sp.]
MRESSPDGPHRAAGRVVTGAIALALGGCAEAPADGGWITILLATAVAAAGVVLGAWWSRLGRSTTAAGLQRCHAERQLWGQLEVDWTWETDASHHLLAWRGPGELPRPAPTGLFGAGTAPPELAATLLARQPFAGLRLRAAEAVEGSVGWELRGAPRHDDLGGFAGFAGRARPTDLSDSLRADAAALGPALAAHAEPALLLHLTGPSRQLRHANAAALALWPRVAAGDSDAAWATLPLPVRSACHDLAAGDATDVEGWRVNALAGLPADGRHLLLVRQATLPAGPPAPPETSEGDSFSFAVTHDLRAPIRVVEGFARIVKEDYGRLLDRVGNDHLDRVLGAAARMNLMIDALLTLARLSTQPLERQPVNLSQLAGWVVEDLRRGSPARLAEIEIEPGLAAQGDPTLLRQLLENLLGNAWKYSAQREPARISLRRLPHDAHAVFEVRDNGAGFDMRSAERLFGLFQRLHSASDFPGHGVGLASVRRIVRRHGGEIWAEAEPGRGAAFFFTLG